MLQRDRAVSGQIGQREAMGVVMMTFDNVTYARDFKYNMYRSKLTA